MSISYHPLMGTVIICDFNGIEPEMVKRRLSVVVSPRFRNRYGLCTVVPLSTTPPYEMAPYHCKLEFDEPLPYPYNSLVQWVKGDMLATVSFDRLFLPSDGKDDKGKRKYITKILCDADLRKVRECMLHALSFSHLTEYL
jgi:mRNA interferase MazF